MRGTGTALVYYAVVPRANSFSGAYAEIERHVGSSFGLLAGYAWSQHDYTDKTGYDRYDALSGYQSYTLATTTTNGFYGGMRIGDTVSGLVLAGAAKQSIAIAQAASGVTIAAPSMTPFVSVGLAWRLGKKRQ